MHIDARGGQTMPLANSGATKKPAAQRRKMLSVRHTAIKASERKEQTRVGRDGRLALAGALGTRKGNAGAEPLLIDALSNSFRKYLRGLTLSPAVCHDFVRHSATLQIHVPRSIIFLLIRNNPIDSRNSVST